MIIPKLKKAKYFDGKWEGKLPDFGGTLPKDFYLGLKGSKIKVHLTEDSSIPEQGYKILVDEKGIAVMYSSTKGCFNAATTLKQFLIIYGYIPYCTIEDAPNVLFRAYMLDSARYFFTVEEIKKQIRYLALFKINCFHWHLTEDQGWRIEIKKYPLLTEIGSSRNRTHMHFKKHSGFYTQSEIKEIVAYAHSYNMIVIPEIEMPGHATAAIASYPELSCLGQKVKVSNTFGIKYETFCPAKEYTMQFIKDVIDEVTSLFPDPYFHIGGDEVLFKRWSQCPLCKKKKDDLGYETWNEYQAHFSNEVADYLKTKGKKTIMWNEAKTSGVVNKELIWQCWNIESSSNAISNELKLGRHLINSISSNYYIDLPYGLVSLEKTYAADPYAESGTHKPQIIGVTIPLWTELIPNQKKAEQMTFPRALAAADRTWNNEDNYCEFKKRAKVWMSALKNMGINVAKPRRYEPKKLQILIDKIWWARRMLYWGGLQNIFLNAKANKVAKKLNDKN